MFSQQHAPCTEVTGCGISALSRFIEVDVYC